MTSTLQQIDLLLALFRRYPSTFSFVCESSQIMPEFRTGRLVSLLGIEGLHQIGGSFSVLRMLYRLGVRYATLCHNKANEFADSAVSTSARRSIVGPSVEALTLGAGSDGGSSPRRTLESGNRRRARDEQDRNVRD